MTHWTSILFYLWRNTFKRWLEYPFPALTKILVPALLAALGVGALSMFVQIERELEHKLRQASALRVHVSEFVTPDRSSSMIPMTEFDQVMWTSRFGSGNIRFGTQMLTSAFLQSSPLSRSIPVYSMRMDLARENPPGPEDMPSVRLFALRPMSVDAQVITMAGMKVRAETAEMPKELFLLTGEDRMVVIPEAMSNSLTRGGYVHHMWIELNSIGEVKDCVAQIRAYTRAQQRQVKIDSALTILRDLERITDIQRIVRRLIVAGCCVILALTLGSIAWLEYRQDAYLLALLRSFGTPSPILFLHALMENLLLVMLGISSVLATWKVFYSLILENMAEVGFEVAGAPILPGTDLLLIVFGGLGGVLLAMLPVALGLRKPTGYTLQ